MSIADAPSATDPGTIAAAVLDRAPEHLARCSWTAERIAEHQQVGLRCLLSHAIEHSSFHGRRLEGLDPSSFSLSDLSRLPIMTKSEMMADLDGVLTDPRLTRQVVEDHLAGLGTELDLLNDRYVVIASGGSSGERGVFVYDLPDYIDFSLSIIRAFAGPVIADWTPGRPTIPAAMIAAGSTAHATGASARVTGVGGPVEMTVIGAATPLVAMIERINQIQPLILAGYPTIMAQLAAAQQAGEMDIRPFVIGATSDLLTEEISNRLTAAFGTAPTNTFGSSEGLTGTSVPGETAISFAGDLCIVELVDEDNAPVEPGVASAKVLVTNLSNLTQPLIRYELSDRFTEVERAEDHGYLRAVVHGRNDDPFRYRGQELHPSVIRAELVRTPAVFEYQVRQTETGADIDVVVASGFDADELSGRLVDALGRAGLDEPEVGVHVVASIPRSPLTGKAQRFVALGRP